MEFNQLPNEFYPTPPELAAKMVNCKFLKSEIKTILEPSAGKGDLIDFLLLTIECLGYRDCCRYVYKSDISMPYETVIEGVINEFVLPDFKKGKRSNKKLLLEKRKAKKLLKHGTGGMKMEILVKGNKKQSLIFGCRDCGCIFIANADEYTYNDRLEDSYCECPECGATCTGTEISCYFCKYIYTGQCDSKHNSVYDKEICDSFKVNKSKLWSWLGYQNEEE